VRSLGTGVPPPSPLLSPNHGGGGYDDGEARKEDVRLPGKGNAISHGARPVHLIITMMKWIKWIRTSRLSIKNSLFDGGRATYQLPEVNSIGPDWCLNPDWCLSGKTKDKLKANNTPDWCLSGKTKG